MLLRGGWKVCFTGMADSLGGGETLLRQCEDNKHPNITTRALPIKKDFTTIIK